MSGDQRYEIKFILDEGKLAEFTSWMYCYTGAQAAYSPRNVNSLYFDDISYESVRDNLAGVSDRKKTRLRWYHNSDSTDISSLALELKVRDGRLGYKKTYPLPTLQQEIMTLEAGTIYEQAVEELEASTPQHILGDDYYVPTLHISYFREYFEDMNGLRITLDHNINFHQVMPHSQLLQGISSPYAMHIAELKFSPHTKPKVIELLRSLHMTPKRHSKYLVGLSVFGQAIYI